VRHLLIPISILLWLNSFSQEAIIKKAAEFIQSSNYEGASRYLDSILAKNPKCVDALMMKGNVIINSSLINEPAVLIEGSDDESIFNSTIGSIGDNPKILPVDSAKKVEQLWKKCLELDHSRIDIHRGLCTLYGMALMKNELLKELPQLIKSVKTTDDDFIYGLEDYAQAFKARHRFDDCMDIYKAIATEFPETGGLLCDVAVMYYRDGKINEALNYAHKAISKPNIDFLTAYSAASMIAIASDMKEGIELFSKGEWDKKEPLYLYYSALIAFYNNDNSWKESLDKFISKYKSKEEDDPRPVMAKMMLKKDFVFDQTHFAELMSTVPYELDILLLGTKATEMMPGTYEPLNSLANMYAGQKCYNNALSALAQIGKLKLSAKQDSLYHFHLAYVQYMMGNKTASIENWKMLLQSGDFFTQSAACYFLGNIYFEQGKKDKAIDLYKQVAGRASESKFANFCRWKVEGMK
jgi:tetratricopeptide (TPR) repeat protein